MMTFGERLKDVRNAAGLTQKELANKAGIAEITIRNYESNKYKPKFEHQVKLSNALGMPREELLGYEYEGNGSWGSTVAQAFDDMISIGEAQARAQRKRLIWYFNKLDYVSKNKVIERAIELTQGSRYETDPIDTDKEED